MMCIRRILAFSSCLLFLLAEPALAVGGWQAGVARVTITPEAPLWMSGYAARTKPAEGKLHDLWAKALVLQDDRGERAVLVTLDLVGIGREMSQSICAELQQRHGLERRQIAINCSHTHCGPATAKTLDIMFDENYTGRDATVAYTQALRQKIVGVVGAAFDKLRPALVSYGTGTCDIAVNRRANKEADVPDLRAAGKLLGPVDHAVPVLVVRSSAKVAADEMRRIVAIVFGYACHATTLGFYQWCGDYPGFACLALEHQYPEATALFWAGCGGDQNPLPRKTVELAESYGQRLASAAETVVDGPLEAVTGSLKSTYREVDLAFDQLPTASELDEQMLSKNKYEARRAKRLRAQLAAGQPLAPSYPYPVQTWALGSDLRWCFLGGEVVVDYVLTIKSRVQPSPVWVAGYTNDVMAYIPSRRVLFEGGYEGGGAMVYYGLPTTWAPTVETTILDETFRQLRHTSAADN